MKRNHSSVLLFLLAGLVCATVAEAHPGHGPDETGSPSEVAQLRDTLKPWRARLAADPGDAGALANLGSIYLNIARRTANHADFAEAEGMFIAILRGDGADDSARYGLACSQLGLHKFKEALDNARRAEPAHPGSDQIASLICDIHLALGNNAEAGMIAEALAARWLTLESLSRVALVKQARGEHREAAKAMRDAFEAGKLLDAPARSLAWCRSILGDFALELGRLDEARGEFETALALDPGCHHARWRLAQIDIRQVKGALAVEPLRALVEQIPKPAYILTLADAVEAGAPGAGSAGPASAHELRARAEAAMASELASGGLGHVRELVEFWLAHPEFCPDGEKAVELALRDLNEVRRDAGAFGTAAWALMSVGKPGEAAPLAREAALRAPGDPRTQCRAGIVLCAAGRRDQGFPMLRSALQSPEALEPALLARAREAAESVAGK